MLHLSSRKLSSSVEKATRADESAPKRKHIDFIVESTHTSFSPTLVKALTSIPLAFKPPTQHFQTLADAVSPLGNSIHNPSSAAGLGIRYHGLRSFKALIVVHSILHDGPHGSAKWVESELGIWMDGLMSDREWCVGRKTGYATLVPKYSKYLTERVKHLNKLGLEFDMSPDNEELERPTSADQIRSILSYIQITQASIRKLGSSLLSTLERLPTSNCIIAVLRLLLRDCSILEQAQKCLLKNLHLLDSEIVGSSHLRDPALLASQVSEGNEKRASWYEAQYQAEVREMGIFVALCDKWVCQVELGVAIGDTAVSQGTTN